MALASLAEDSAKKNDLDRKESEDQVKLINGEYNDLLDHEMPKVSCDRVEIKYEEGMPSRPFE